MMRHRQAPDDRVFGPDAERLIRRLHAFADGFVSQHHALAGIRRAGREADESDVQPVIIRRRWLRELSLMKKPSDIAIAPS